MGETMQNQQGWSMEKWSGANSQSELEKEDKDKDKDKDEFVDQKKN